MFTINTVNKLFAYDAEGNRIPERDQVIHNAIIKEIDPDFDAIIIVSSDDEKQISTDEAEFAEQVASFSKPVTVNGKEYFRAFAWGSSVKSGVTLGLTSDYFAEKGILNFTEDTYRLMRAYMPNCTAALRGDFRVKAVEIGTTLGNGHRVDDGWGYIRRSVAEQINPKFRKVSVGKWNGSLSFMQRFTFNDALLADLGPDLIENVNLINSDDFTQVIAAKGSDLGTKSAFLEADAEEMKYHPFIANQVSDARAMFGIRVATTGGFRMDGGLFAPTNSENVILPGCRFNADSQYIGTRYPIDSESSIRLVDVETTGDEADRLAEMEALQYTLTEGFSKAFKGMLGIIDDEDMPEGVDIVVCVEDLKMDRNGKVEKIEADWVLEDAILGITQWFAAGSCVGIPQSLAKKLGADYDGDQGAFLRASRYPEMAKQVESFKDLPNPKLPKTKTPVTIGESRAKSALLSMANLVGIATNTLSTVLATRNQELVANEVGFKSADDMHIWLMKSIKIGTDIFKTSVDWRPVATRLSQINAKLRSIGVRAPWNGWLKDTVAFRHEMPAVIAKHSEVKNLSEWGKKNWVLEDGTGIQDGVLAEMLRITLPRLDMPMGVEVKPLAHYRDYVVAPTNAKVVKVVSTMIQRYAQRIKVMNFSDTEAWEQFVEEWQAAINDVIAKMGFDRQEFAEAMWYAVHDTQRHDRLAGMASAIFKGMPDEALDIVQRKPGAALNEAMVIAGLQYQLPNAQAGMMFKGHLHPVPQANKAGATVIRYALVSDDLLPGQQQPRKDGYPANMLGMVALNSSSATTKPAMYRIEPGTGKSWVARIV